MQNPFKGKTPEFSHIDVRSMTFHRAKGLEADYTVLLDVSEGNFGVPSQIEDDVELK
jgi:DNA helicase-4